MNKLTAQLIKHIHPIPVGATVQLTYLNETTTYTVIKWGEGGGFRLITLKHVETGATTLRLYDVICDNLKVVQ